MPNVNHDGYDDRLAFVKTILQNYDLQFTDIEPIAYEEDCPFQFNNFIYKIQLLEPVTELFFRNAPPHSVKPLTDVSTLVLRLSNPAAMGLNSANRVQNEVAAMTLAREGLRAFKPGLEVLVPAIYAWKAHSVTTDTPEFGWILMEYKSGVPLDGHFASRSEEEKKTILEKIADVIAGIESAQLPSTADQFGGLTIDHEGTIVSGEMTIVQGGPWKTYEAWWQGRLRDQLKGADKSPVIEGWSAGDLRGRIEKFITHGIIDALIQAGVDSSKRVLIHGDFTMNNMLVDPDTNQLTAVLDFDFSSIGLPAHLFFSSLQDLGSSSDQTGGKLTKALLTGSFEDFSDLSDEGRSILIQARDLDQAMMSRGSVRPSEIRGLETLSQLAQLERLICPFRLVVPMFLAKKTKEEISDARSLAEKTLVKQLELLGY